VTGGAGYIGSHAVLQLLTAGFRVVVLDSLANSSELVIRRLRSLAGADNAKNLAFHKVVTPANKHARCLSLNVAKPFPFVSITRADLYFCDIYICAEYTPSCCWCGDYFGLLLVW